MEFNNLLFVHGFDPKDVALMLHTPVQAHQKHALLALVEDQPALFEAYQDNHPANPETTLKQRKFAASFVVGDRSEAHFVGMYRIAGWSDLSAAELDADPSRKRVQELFGGSSFAQWAVKTGTSGRAAFDLRPVPELAELKGRLIALRPAGRAFMRLAENNVLEILEIRREARFSPPAPDWREFIVTGVEMRGLPKSWASRLREWRGIYLVVDQRDGARYVGSAYGESNLLGRWQAHVASDLGVTVELSKRDPAAFRFSILELVSPSATSDEVIALESGWKRRIDTLFWGLNRN